MDCNECLERLFPENPTVGFYDFRTKRYFHPLCEGCANKENDELADRVSNLEAISAQPGRIPRAYYDRFKQMQWELAYLHNKVSGESARKPVLSHGVKL